MKNIKKNILISFICVILLFAFIKLFRITIKTSYVHKIDLSCYNQSSTVNGLQELDDSTENEEIKLGKNIFFHETSCFVEEGGTLLNARQACAVESAAKMNPNMSIYLLYLSPSKCSKSTEHLFQALLSYKNVKIRRIIADKYMQNTPLEKWYATGIFKTSLWPVSHMSDILRYLTLWKYGGIYMDLDVVVLKPLEDLQNFASEESSTLVASNVLGFGIDKVGRKVAEKCLENLRENFNGSVFIHNGPGVITRTLQKICNASYTYEMTNAHCNGFKVFPASVFNPIYFNEWRKFFEPDSNNETMNILKNAKAIHVWNKLSHEQMIQIGSNVPYEIIAQECCPKVYNNIDKYF